MASGETVRMQEHLAGGRQAGRHRSRRGWLPVLVAALMLVPLGPLARGDSPSQGGIWTPTGSMTYGRYYHTATLLPNEQVLVAGGQGGAGVLSSAELYDSRTGTWITTSSLLTPRYGHTATLLPNGKVLVTGGGGPIYPYGTASAELYDPSTGTWTPTGSMTTGRIWHTATLLPNGQVLVAGGDTPFYPSGVTSAELYNPSTGIWTPTGSMFATRNSGTATLLATGKVLVAGGCSCTRAELYDPGTGTWTTTGSMTNIRNLLTATLLNNGHVLVAGGYNGTFLASAEVYNPSTGTWTRTGSMSVARSQHTATLLPNGQVLVAGGYNQTYNYLSSAEVYNPSTGVWTSTESMAVARYVQTATLLPNGQILAAGGYDYTILASAELYTQSTANLMLSPTSGSYKESLVITGTAFAPNEIVNIYADMTTTAPIYTANAGPDGSFVLHTTVLQGPYGSHTLIGVGRHSGLFGSAAFFETPRLIMTPNSGTVGATITAHGYGFGADETVQVYWRNPKQLLGMATTNSYGTFTGSSAVTFTIPSGAPPGSNIVYGVGQTTHAIGNGTVTVH